MTAPINQVPDRNQASSLFEQQRLVERFTSIMAELRTATSIFQKRFRLLFTDVNGPDVAWEGEADDGTTQTLAVDFSSQQPQWWHAIQIEDGSVVTWVVTMSEIPHLRRLKTDNAGAAQQEEYFWYPEVAANEAVHHELAKLTALISGPATDYCAEHLARELSA